MKIATRARGADDAVDKLNKRSGEAVGRREVQLRVGKFMRKVRSATTLAPLAVGNSQYAQNPDFYRAPAIGWQLTASLQKPMAEPITRTVRTKASTTGVSRANNKRLYESSTTGVSTDRYKVWYRVCEE